MSAYTQLCEKMRAEPSTWLVTGVAGFIGSNLLEHLLKMGQTVVGLDNFLTGYQKNLDMVEALVGPEAWSRFTFIEGDIRDLDTCRKACEGVDHVLHEAALGSVPRSIDDPILSNSCNITGYLNMLVAARDAGVKSFVYAASSSTYGDSPELPKVEDKIGNPLSPYAVTKYVDELYADVFARCYGFTTVGLRYFNVFGQRQDPYGAYGHPPVVRQPAEERDRLRQRRRRDQPRLLLHRQRGAGQSAGQLRHGRSPQQGLQRGLWPAHDPERTVRPHP